MEIFTKNSAKCTILQSNNYNNFSSLMNAEEYAECCNSVGKQVLSEGSTLHSDEEIEVLMMVLHMNNGFMIHMQENYWATVQEIFGRTAVPNVDFFEKE
jgi:hypothetical protein